MEQEPDMAAPQLSIKDASGHGRTIVPGLASITIGSAPDCQIVVDAPGIEAQHAEILASGDRLSLLALHATGITVDGRPVVVGEEVDLATGSVVVIGNVQITVVTPALDLLQSLLALPAGRSRRAGDTPVLRETAPAAPSRDTRPLTAPPPAQPPPPISPPPADQQAPVSPGHADDDALLQQLLAQGETPAPPPVREAAIALRLAAERLTVAAGQVTLLTVDVENRSDIIDSIRIAVEGLPSHWVAVAPASISLLPNTAGQARVTINPPRVPASGAGDHPFTVVAASQANPNERNAASATLTIEPFDDVVFDTLFGEQVTRRIRLTGIEYIDQDVSVCFFGVEQVAAPTLSPTATFSPTATPTPIPTNTPTAREVIITTYRPSGTDDRTANLVEAPVVITRIEINFRRR